MSKTTARTFILAAVLLAMCVMTYMYGHRSVENQLIAAGEALPPFSMDDYYPYYMELKTWEQAAAVIGLLGVSLSVAGAIRWDREMSPELNQSSILGLNEQATKRIVRSAAPQNVVSIAAARLDESNARWREEESLTPLERVIRGY